MNNTSPTRVNPQKLPTLSWVTQEVLQQEGFWADSGSTSPTEGDSRRRGRGKSQSDTHSTFWTSKPQPHPHSLEEPRGGLPETGEGVRHGASLGRRGSLPRHQIGLEGADDDRGVVQLLLEKRMVKIKAGRGGGDWLTGHWLDHQGLFYNPDTQAFCRNWSGGSWVLCPCPWGFTPKTDAH